MTRNGATWTYTYDANGMRKSRSNGTDTYSYVYNGGKLMQMTKNGTVVNFTYIGGIPATMTFNATTYYYVTNAQGDIIGITDSSGNLLISYSYDAWGNAAYVSVDTTMAPVLAAINPLLYRGYVFDTGTGLYYLQSRYYNPEMGRFINADDITYLGTGSNLTSFNLFAYCGNNPVMGYDPTGHWDWGGVIIGLGIIAATVITVATFGVGTAAGALVAGAAITTGATMTCAAATDSAMTIDLSYSVQTSSTTYGKAGVSLVIDFGKDESHLYTHTGGGYGYSSGVSYSTGIISNYEDPQDYAGDFTDVSAGYNVGIDHCWTPQEGVAKSTQAKCITFSPGVSFGVGYDYYSDPICLSKW